MAANRSEVGTTQAGGDSVIAGVPGDHQGLADKRAATGPRATMVEVGHALLVIALASGLAEAGVQYASVYGPGKTGVGVEVYHDNLTGLLLHGRGNAWVVDGEGGHRLIPGWWAFLAFAAAGAILVKTPLLFAPAWLGGRAVARGTGRYPLGVAYLVAAAVGATLGVMVFHVYQSMMSRHLIWRVWGLHFLPGFGGCLAGGACGVVALAGRGRRRGLGSSLTEIALIDLIILGTAWLVRCR